MAAFDVGAKFSGIQAAENAMVLLYDLVTTGDGAQRAFEVRVPFAALDLVHKTLGGKSPMTMQERFEMVGAFALPVLKFHFDGPPAPPAADASEPKREVA